MNKLPRSKLLGYKPLISAPASLYHQCAQVFAKGACEALAEVYYAAVRRFGGGDATKRETQEELNKAYDDAVVAYNEAVKQAQEEGLLPVLE